MHFRPATIRIHLDRSSRHIHKNIFDGLCRTQIECRYPEIRVCQLFLSIFSSIFFSSSFLFSFWILSERRIHRKTVVLLFQRLCCENINFWGWTVFANGCVMCVVVDHRHSHSGALWWLGERRWDMGRKETIRFNCLQSHCNLQLQQTVPTK